MNKLTNIDGIIFDMDGVLVDERQSCRLATIKTVNYFLDKDSSSMKVTTNEGNIIKFIPGFNDDHDCAFVLLSMVRKNISIRDYTKYAKPVSKSFKNSNKNYKLVRDTWQMFYLGSELFEKIEKRKPLWNNEKGLIYNESLLISKKTLKTLYRSFPLAIATGRPRIEALFAINQFSLNKFFREDCIIGRDDAKFTKPNPAPLLEAKKRIKSNYPIYVGDTINDVMAAQRAGMSCIFVGSENLGDYQIKKTDELIGGIFNV